ETAIAAAPGLDHAYVYIAPQTSPLPAVLNAIVADAPATGVRIVSDSWGICEPLISPARAAATNQALQLAAVSGITVLAASGDSGSFDCSGFPTLAVDDPAAQPFATGVGGTTLHLGLSGSRHEVVWDDAAGAGGGWATQIRSCTTACGITGRCSAMSWSATTISAARGRIQRRSGMTSRAVSARSGRTCWPSISRATSPARRHRQPPC